MILRAQLILSWPWGGTQLTSQGLSSLMNLEVRLNVHIFTLPSSCTCLQKTYVCVMSGLGFQRSFEWTQVLSGPLSRSQLNAVCNEQKKPLAPPYMYFILILKLLKELVNYCHITKYLIAYFSKYFKVINVFSNELIT